MKKTLIVLILIINSITGFSQISVTVDSIRQKSDTLWISNRKGSITYIRTSGDSLYLGDVSGEMYLGLVNSGGSTTDTFNVKLVRFNSSIPIPDYIEGQSYYNSSLNTVVVQTPSGNKFLVDSTFNRDSMYILGQNEWIYSSDTIEKIDSSNHALIADYANNSDTSDYAYNSDSTFVTITADTTKTSIVSGNNLKLDLGTSKTSGVFYSGTTNPTNLTRLNWDGYLYATSIQAAQNNNTGILASGSTAGVYGYTTTNRGVYGLAASTGYGGYFSSLSGIPLYATTAAGSTVSTQIASFQHKLANRFNFLVGGELQIYNNSDVLTYELNNDSLKAPNVIAEFKEVNSEKSVYDTSIIGGDTITGGLSLKDAVEAEQFDKIDVDTIEGNTVITGDLNISGHFIRENYEAAAYLHPDSTIVTSINSTTFTFLGSGSNNKFTNIESEGFTLDGDTLMFIQDVSDLRDSVEFHISYSCESATASVNRTIFIGIFIKHSGGSYQEYLPTTRRSRTSTAGVYYPGPTCTPMPIWLKNDDKIQIRAKCASTTATLSTQSFGIYLYEE